MSSKETVVLLGAGKIGRMVAHFLGQSGDYRLRVGDVRLEAAQQAVARFPTHAAARALSFDDGVALDELMAGATAVISCAPFHANPTIALHERFQLVPGDEVVDQLPIDLRHW